MHYVPEPDPITRYVETIGSEPNFPSFALQIRRILSGLQRPQANLREIAELVLCDYTLSMQVIRAGNSALYNRSGRPMQDIKQAMLMLGSRVVRELAAGIIFFEHYKRRSAAVRDILLRSTLTAAHARALAARVGVEAPETAYLCGMFYNLGELVVAAHFPRDYAAIARKRKEAGISEAYAVRSIMKCSYEELGIAIGQVWRLPDEVLATMRESGSPADPRLRPVVRMAHELTEAAYRSSEADSREAIQQCYLGHGAKLRLSRKDVAEVLALAVDDARGLFASAGVRIDELRMSRDHQLATTHLTSQFEELAPQSGAAL